MNVQSSIKKKKRVNILIKPIFTFIATPLTPYVNLSEFAMFK